MHLKSGIVPESGERIVSLPTFKTLTTATAVIDGGSSLTCYCKGWGNLSTTATKFVNPLRT